MAAHFEQISARRVERVFYFHGHDPSFSINRSICCKFHRKPGLRETRESNPWSKHSETPKNWAGLANLIFNIPAYITKLAIYSPRTNQNRKWSRKELIVHPEHSTLLLQSKATIVYRGKGNLASMRNANKTIKEFHVKMINYWKIQSVTFQKSLLKNVIELRSCKCMNCFLDIWQIQSKLLLTNIITFQNLHKFKLFFLVSFFLSLFLPFIYFSSFLPRSSFHFFKWFFLSFLPFGLICDQTAKF